MCFRAHDILITHFSTESLLLKEDKHEHLTYDKITLSFFIVYDGVKRKKHY